MQPRCRYQTRRQMSKVDVSISRIDRKVDRDTISNRWTVGAASGYPSDLDLKIGIVLGRGLLLVDAAHVGETRAFAERRGQIGKFIGRPGGVYFDASIVQIAHVAGHTQRVRHALRVVAIADALHAPAHEVEARGLGVAGRGKTRIA